MEFLLENTNFEAVAIIDEFESAIWVERYWEYGDFEFKLAPTRENVLRRFRDDYYLSTTDSEVEMIIEERLLETDAEDGNWLYVRGRSLESILDRRIIWAQTNLNYSTPKDNPNGLQRAIKKWITDSIIAPTSALADRKIDNFIFEDTDDPVITKIPLKVQYTGDNLYDVIQYHCQANNLGFKIRRNAQNQFVFKLYAGVDHSHEQTENDYVVFSPSYDNIINSNFLESKKVFRNVALVRGEGEGTSRKTATVGSGKGLERRELNVDARDISTNSGAITGTKYTNLLKTRGTEKLAEDANKYVKTFEGQVEQTQSFQYGKDYFMGDVVQITNEFDIEATTRVIELIRSDATDGIDVIVPTFADPTDPVTPDYDDEDDDT